MARQNSLFKVKGTLDDVTFYERQGVHLVKKKTRLSGDRIKNDPAFERTQETFREFGTTNQVARLVRNAFPGLIKKVGDKRVPQRLTRVLFQIRKFDVTNKRGSRTAVIGLDTDSGKEVLTGFNFNIGAPLKQILPLNPVVDTSANTISINGLNPKEMLSIPSYASHFKLTGYWSRIDFLKDDYQSVRMSLDPIPLDETIQNLVLSPTESLTGDGRDLVVLLIEFMIEDAGILYPMKDKSHNAAAIVSVS
ncbi:MAG: hypothetical protein K9I85_05120 [Saprospiraceae bacterium]|nr:hypothetical protein [Saprospiraceae bacterium]